jgi:hypothetical protein
VTTKKGILFMLSAYVNAAKITTERRFVDVFTMDVLYARHETLGRQGVRLTEDEHNLTAAIYNKTTIIIHTPN